MFQSFLLLLVISMTSLFSLAAPFSVTAYLRDLEPSTQHLFTDPRAFSSHYSYEQFEKLFNQAETTAQQIELIKEFPLYGEERFLIEKIDALARGLKFRSPEVIVSLYHRLFMWLLVSKLEVRKIPGSHYAIFVEPSDPGAGKFYESWKAARVFKSMYSVLPIYGFNSAQMMEFFNYAHSRRSGAGFGNENPIRSQEYLITGSEYSNVIFGLLRSGQISNYTQLEAAVRMFEPKDREYEMVDYRTGIHLFNLTSKDSAPYVLSFINELNFQERKELIESADQNGVEGRLSLLEALLESNAQGKGKISDSEVLDLYQATAANYVKYKEGAEQILLKYPRVYRIVKSPVTRIWNRLSKKETSQDPVKPAPKLEAPLYKGSWSAGKTMCSSFFGRH